MRAILLLAALLALPSVGAQVHALPAWSVGDSWSYATSFRDLPGNLTLIVEDATAGRHQVLGVQDEMTPFGVPIEQRYRVEVLPDSLARARFAYEGGAAWRIEPPCQEYRFPLVVGATWTSECAFVLETTNETTWFNSTWRVASYERVTVPAGTFDAFVVEQLLDGTLVKRWWAPEACHYVRLLQEGDAVRTEDLLAYECASRANHGSPATPPSSSPPPSRGAPGPSLALVAATVVVAAVAMRRKAS